MQSTALTVKEILLNGGFLEQEIPPVAWVLGKDPDELANERLIADVRQFLKENRSPAFGSVIAKIEKAFGLKLEGKVASTLAGEVVKPQKPSGNLTGELISLLEKTAYADFDLHPERYQVKFEITKDDQIPQELYAPLESLLRAYGLVKDDQLDRNGILALQTEYFAKQSRGEEVSNLKFAHIVTLIKQIAVFKATSDVMRDRVKQELLETPLKDNPKLVESIASTAVDVVLKSAAKELPNVPKVDDVGLKSGLALEAALRQAYGIAPSEDFYQAIIDKNIDMKQLASRLSSFGTVSSVAYLAAKDAKVSEKTADTLEQFGKDVEALAGYGAVSPATYYEAKPREGKITPEEMQKEKALGELKQKYGEGGLKRALSMLGAPLAGAGMSFFDAGKTLESMPEVGKFGLPAPVTNTSKGVVPIDTAKELMTSLQRYSGGKPFFDGQNKLSGRLPGVVPAVLAGALARGLAAGRPTPDNLSRLAGGLSVSPGLGVDSLVSLGYPVAGRPGVPTRVMMPVSARSNPLGRIARALEGMPPELVHEVMNGVGSKGGVSLFPFAGGDMRGVRAALGIAPTVLSDADLRRAVAAGGDGVLNRVGNTVAPRQPIDNAIYRELMARYLAQQRGLPGVKPASLKEAYARQNAEYLKAMKQRRDAMTQALIDEEKAKQRGRGIAGADEGLAYKVEKFVRTRIDEILGLPGRIGASMVKRAQAGLLEASPQEIEVAERLATRGRALLLFSQRTQGVVHAVLGLKDTIQMFLGGMPVEAIKAMWGMLGSIGTVTGNKRLENVSGVFGTAFGWMVNLKNLIEAPGETAKELAKKQGQRWFLGRLGDGIKFVWDKAIKPFVINVTKRAGIWLLTHGLINSSMATGFFGLSSAEIGAATGLLAGGAGAVSAGAAGAAGTAGAVAAGGGATVGAGAGVGAAGGLLGSLFTATGALSPVGWIFIIGTLALCCCCMVFLFASGLFSGIGVTMQETARGAGEVSIYGPQYFDVNITKDSIQSDPATKYVNGITYTVTLKYIGPAGSVYRVNTLAGELDGFNPDVQSNVGLALASNIPTYEVSAAQRSGEAYDYSIGNPTFFGIDHLSSETLDVTMKLSMTFERSIDQLLAGVQGDMKMCNLVVLDGQVDGQTVQAIDSICISPYGEIIDDVVCPFLTSEPSIACTQGSYSNSEWSHSGSNEVDLKAETVVSPVEGEVVDVKEMKYCHDVIAYSERSGGYVVVKGDDGYIYSFYHIVPADGLANRVGVRVSPGDPVGSAWTAPSGFSNACWTGWHVHAMMKPPTGSKIECEYRERFGCDIDRCYCASGVYCNDSCDIPR